MCTAPLRAQSEDVEIRRQALDDFNIGKFDQVIESLTTYLDRGPSAQRRTQVYMHVLLANTYLAIDSPEEAREHVVHLLNLDANFNPSDYETERLDPTPFKDLVSEVGRELSAVLVSSVSKRSENYREAPATVVLITEEQIKQRGYQDLEALLHDLPGFDISRGNGIFYSNIYQRGHRSTSTNRTLFLVDGVEENSLWSSAIWLSRQYPLSNIKRVEVVYGPASTMYGSNAFLGVINVVTKQPIEVMNLNKRFGLYGQVNLGQPNVQYGDLTMAWNPAENVFFSLTARFYQANERDLSGFEDWDYQTPDAAFYRNALKDLTGSTGSDVDSIAQANVGNPLVTIERDGDTVTIKPTEAAVQKVMEKDATILQGTSGYSNTTDDWLVNAKLRMGNLTLGAQTWKREEGVIGWFTDVSQASSDGGSAWVPRQTFFYVKYEDRFFSNKVLFSSFTRYKLHDLGDDTRLVNFNSYASGRLDLADLLVGRFPFYSGEFRYNISRQLRHEMQAVFEPFENVSVVSGVEYRSSIIQGEYVVCSDGNAPEEGEPVCPDENAREEGEPVSVPEGGNHFNSRDVGLYAQANYHWNDWLTLVGGFRVDNNKVRSTGGYGTQWSGRLAVVATPGPPDRNWILKVILSNAFKDADNQAKYSTLKGIRDFPNPGLQLEKVDNYEVSVGKQITPTLFADLVGYYARYNRVIGTQVVPCVEFEKLSPSYQCNPGATTSQQNGDLGPLEIGGFQSTLSFEWPSTLLGWQLSGYANYTFTHPYSTDFKPKPDTTLGRRRIGDIASHRVNVGLNGRRKSLNVNVRMNYVGDRKTGAETTVKGNTFDKIDAYMVFHAAVSFEISDKATLQLVGNNLFNKPYYHPGVRTASGSFASRLPQDERQLLLRLLLRI